MLALEANEQCCHCTKEDGKTIDCTLKLIRKRLTCVLLYSEYLPMQKGTEGDEIDGYGGVSLQTG